MPIVPFSRNTSATTPSGPPVDETYLMMAAAQMHKEGRLVQNIPPTTRNTDLDALIRGPQTKPPGFEEWEKQGPSEMLRKGEREDLGGESNKQIEDIYRLFNNRITGKGTNSNI